MKTLTDFANANNLTVIQINYYSQGIKIRRKGYDLCRKTGDIIISFEPCYYSNGDKWFLRNTGINYNGPDYLKRINAKFLSTLNINDKSYVINKSI